MVPTTRLRPVRSEDVPFLYRLYASTRAAEIALLAGDEAQMRAFLAMQFDAQSRYYAIQYPDASFDIVELAGDAIGRFYVDRGEREIRVVDISLLPEFRGQGIGGTLMRGVLDEARGKGQMVSIHVEQSNPAKRLYQRLGFLPVSENGIYQLMEWTADSDGSLG